MNISCKIKAVGSVLWDWFTYPFKGFWSWYWISWKYETEGTIFLHWLICTGITLIISVVTDNVIWVTVGLSWPVVILVPVLIFAVSKELYEMFVRDYKKKCKKICKERKRSKR